MAESLQRDLTRQVERAKQFREDHQKVYYMHFRNGSQRGGLTLAVQRVDLAKWRFGIAICSPLDQFCRRLGRDIARGRMECERATALRGMLTRGSAHPHVPRDIWKRVLNFAKIAVFEGKHGGQFGYMLLSVFEDADRQLSGVKHVEA
jgi:hypothetical protein